MANTVLDGIRLKLRRAEEQYDNMAAAVLGFIADRPLEFKQGIHHKQRQIAVFAEAKKLCPNMWGVQIGEFAHNLRSALDHLIWQLVIHATGHPPTSNKTQFPIFKTREGYETRSDRYIRGVSPPAEAVIRAAQPFHSANPAANPLWMLHELSNFDKHRTLHVTTMAIKSADLSLSGLPTETQPGMSTRRGPLHGFSAVASLSFTEDEWPYRGLPSDQIKWEGMVNVSVVFDRGNPAEGCPVVETMWAMKTEVHSHIKQIANTIFELEDP